MITNQQQKHVKVLSSVFVLLLLACTPSKKQRLQVAIFSKTYPPLKYKIVGATINGKKIGLWTTFDSTGRVESEQTYYDDKAFGEIRIYSNSFLTQKVIDSIHKSDTISLYQKYNTTGKIIACGRYLNGNKTGTWVYYDETGKKIKRKVEYTGNKAKTLYKDSVESIP